MAVRRVGYVPEVSDQRLVVCGPPGAGKTTFVDSVRQPGDLVFDLDRLADAMFLLPKFPRADDVVAVLNVMREAVVAHVRRFGFEGKVYIIAANIGHARSVARELGAEIKVMEALPVE